MPSYDYRCAGCGKSFTRESSLTEHDAGPPACPKCGSRDVAQSFSAVYVKTSKKS